MYFVHAANDTDIPSSISDEDKIIIIAVVSSVAGLELITLLLILLLCIIKTAKKRGKYLLPDKEPELRHKERTESVSSRNSQVRNHRLYSETRTSEYYATISEVCDVTPPTTPSITTAPNPSYRKNSVIDVRTNQAYNHFSSSQESDFRCDNGDIDGANQVNFSNDEAYDRLSTADSTVSYQYPSQRVN